MDTRNLIGIHFAIKKKKEQANNKKVILTLINFKLTKRVTDAD